jgi:hypothetical protein
MRIKQQYYNHYIYGLLLSDQDQSTVDTLRNKIDYNSYFLPITPNSLHFSYLQEHNTIHIFDHNPINNINLTIAFHYFNQ